MSETVSRQATFFQNLGKLITYVFSQEGWACTEGEGERPAWVAQKYAAEGKGIADSLHIERLAHDIYFYKDEVYITDANLLRQFGEYWKTLHPDNCWGGDFKGKTAGDIYHFSMATGGRK